MKKTKTKLNFTHLSKTGDVQMVDVGHKPLIRRLAIAAGSIHFSGNTLELIASESMKKGNVLSTAKIAGIMAAKKTHELIPLCHPLLLTAIDLEFEMDSKKKAIHVKASTECIHATGVEMEALTAVSVALLTIYDMCKAVDKKMVMKKIFLVKKEKINANANERKQG
jgi:cyclic pyranopterin phosphate synthase